MTLTYFLGKRNTTLNLLISGMDTTNYKSEFKRFGVVLTKQEEEQIESCLTISSNSINEEPIKLIDEEIDVVQEREDRPIGKNKKPASSKKIQNKQQDI
jgi:hypothetical protein